MAWQDYLFNTGDAITTGIWVLLLLIVVGGIIAFILFMRKFENVVIIREIVQGRERVTIDKARLTQDKDGAFWWQLQKEKVKDKKLLPVPPEKALDITKKGKFIVECWRYPTGHVEWIESDHQTNEKDAEFEDVVQNVDGKIVKEKLKKSFTSINNNDRAVLVNQVMKAEANRRKTWKDLIIPIAYISSITIIILVLVIMYGNIAEPVIKAKAIDTAQLEILQEMQIRQQQMEQNIQTISGDNNNQPPP